MAGYSSTPLRDEILPTGWVDNKVCAIDDTWSGLRFSLRTHPHCQVAFDQCRIHHIIWWTLGGKTDLDNLLPMCQQHHHLVHERLWQLTMTPNRVCTWTRPDRTTWHQGQSINHTKHARQPAKPPGSPPIETTPANEYRQPSLC